MKQPSRVRESSAVRTVKCLAAMLVLGALAACGGGGGGSDGTYTVGGTVAGVNGAGLVLRNGDERLSVPASGGFTFAKRLNSGASYTVSVTGQPANQNCSVANGAGTIASAHITNVAVTCVAAEPPPPPPPNTYTVGGEVLGLSGSGLVLSNSLSNNASDDLGISANGAFTFGTRVANGMPYAVTVSTQPSGQSCSVSDGSGTVNGANVSNIVVNCGANAPRVHTIGGTVNTLTATGLVLRNNGGDPITIAAGASAFSFPVKVTDGGSYAVTVATQPGTDLTNSQDCTVANASGTANAEVSTVVVSCGPMGPLTVLGSDPVKEQTDVPRTVQPKINFSSAVNPADLDKFRLDEVDGRIGVATNSVSGSLVTLSPDAKLRPASRYEARVFERLRGTRGEVLGRNHFIGFTTADNTWREASVASGPQALTLELYPASAVDGQGNVLAAWSDTTAGIVVNRYDAATGQWATPTPIKGEEGVSELSPPAMAVDAAGNALVAWSQQNTAGPAYNVIWGARYDRTTNAWSTVGVISHADGSNAFNPVVSLGPDGTAIVAWARRDLEGNAFRYRVWWAHANISRSNGTWSVPRQLASDVQPPSVNHVPVLAAARNASGRTMVVWSAQRAADSHSVIRGAGINPDLSGFDTPVLSNDNLDPEYAPVIAATGNTFHVVWEQSNRPSRPEFRNLWTVAASNIGLGPIRHRVAGTDDGAAWATSPQIAGCAMLTLNCNQTLVLWKEFRPAEGSSQVMTRPVDQSGLPRTPVRLLETDASERILEPRIVMDHSGNAVAAWRQEGAEAGVPGSVRSARYVLDRGWSPAQTLAAQPFSNALVFSSRTPLSLSINPGTGDAAVVWQNVLAFTDGRPTRLELSSRRFD